MLSGYGYWVSRALNRLGFQIRNARHTTRRKSLRHSRAVFGQVAMVETLEARRLLAGTAPQLIEGYVYVDTNNNGLKDSGEAGIPGVVIKLDGFEAGARPIAVHREWTTDANGYYFFDGPLQNVQPGLLAGTYTLTEVQPSGYFDGLESTGQVVLIGQSGTITVLAGTGNGSDTIPNITFPDNGISRQSSNNNFGERPWSSLSGYTYFDANNDGIKDPGETPIAGTTVTLTGTDDLGNPVSATTTTDGTGKYLFSHLRPGTYEIDEDQPVGYLDGKDTLGTPGGTAANDNFSGIVLGAGQNGVNNNFGELLAASLSGYVYVDTNNDGTFQGSETPIAAATVTLSGIDDLGNPVLLTTATDVNGKYAFNNLRPGTYELDEDQPAGYLDGKDTIGTPGGVTTNDNFANILLPAGQNGVDNNFGELLASSLAGFVYVDANNDGIFQITETPIAAAVVTLSGIDDLGNPVSLTATTDSNGKYLFSELRPGTYKLDETQPASYLDGKDTIGTPGGTAANDSFTSIVLAAGVDGVDNNFGELVASSLAGHVYYDANNDGVFLGTESPIAGVSVTLTGTDDLGTLISLTTTTNSDGAYLFSDLRPGTYTIAESQPAGYLDGKDTIGTPGGTGTNDTFSAIVLAAGVNGVDNDFGELRSSSIAGNVYADSNNDGIFQGTEAGLEDVTVTLTGTDDLGNPVSLTTTTTVDGSYQFSDLRPGTYQLVQTQPVDYLDGKDTVGTPGGSTANDQFTAISLSAGIDGINNNFGELIPGTIAGKVYEDTNDNGTPNGGEEGIENVTLTLTGTDDLGNPVSLTTTTDGNGEYSFTNLRPGTYTVAETSPAGYYDGLDANGGVVIGSSRTSDFVTPIVLASGETKSDNNFGELLPAGLAGYVYNDANNDGIYQGTESPISGVTITLTGTDNLGNAVSQTTTTASDGSYHFSDLRPGIYQLAETQPATYIDGKDTLGTPGGATSNDVFSAIVLTAGVHGDDNNFGELKISDIPGSSSLSGYVYVDKNNDGVKQSTETVLSSVTVTLTGTNDLGNAVSLTTTTNSAGFYEFINLRPGTYRINEAQPAGYLDGKDTIGTPGGSTANDVFSGIVLANGVAGVNNNFGELCPASVSGYVYADKNNDGVKQTSESVIASVTVKLTGTDDLGNAVSLTTTTNSSGFYQFTGLRPGTYKITEVQPSGYLDGKDTIGSQGGTTANDVFSNVVLTSGMSGVNNNFGELCPTSVSGYVYVDKNNDGIKQTSETGIASVTVTLTGTNDLGNAVSLTTTTNSSGFYQFTGLRPGTYKITETQPAGYLDGKDTIGTQGGTTSNDLFSNVVLTSGAAGVNNNFGELCPASISGYVYVDKNNDGVKQSGETPLSGVTVKLTGTDNLGNAVSLTTTTNSSGFYQFTGLQPGTYKITETQPSGYLDGKDTIGSQGGSTANDVFSSIVLASGTSGVNNNFGELCPAGLSGYVYVDANNDGVKQSGETAISGVTVKLTGTDDRGNAVSLTTTTNSSGFYQFTGLRPGTYTLTETQPAGYTDGKDTIGSQGGTTGNDVFSNIVLTSGTSGINNNFGEICSSSLSGYVYFDSNNDGVKQSGEAPIAGVTVKLTGTDNLGNAVSLTTTTNSSGFYQFTGLRAGTYKITEVQPVGYTDGKDTIGSQGGTTGNDVFSSITLAAGVNGINNNFGERSSALTCGDTATIGYWQNNNGQALIKSLNGGSTSTALAKWLATTYPNLYGASAGAKAMVSSSGVYKTNAQVAASYITNFFNVSGTKTDAQVLAVALATYVTNSTLAGSNVAAQYGFNVSATGTGAKVFNVGSNGASFGVANNTTITVQQMLSYANSKSKNGVLYSEATTLKPGANVAFTAVNETGDIR